MKTSLFALVLAALFGLAAPAQAAIVVLNGEDVLLMDDSGGWHNVGDTRDYYNGYNRRYAAPVYNYNNTGDPATYEGAPYQNFRGYNNTSGYSNSYYGYISRPGYLGGYYY